MRLARQRQQRNALIHVVVTGVLMPRQVALAAIQFVTPLRGHPPVEALRDSAVQLVHIDGFKSVTQPIDLGTQARDRFVMVPTLNLKTVMERLDDQVIHLLIDPQLPQQARELLFKHFLTHELFGAFPVVAGAVIVDVFALLDLGGQGAAAVAAAYQAGEGKLPHAPARLGVPGFVVAAVKDILNAKPQVFGDQGLVIALIDLPQPLELAGVEAAAQDFMDGAHRHRAPALAVGETLLARHRADFLQGVAARRIPLEQAGDDRSLIGFDGNPLLAVRSDDVPVSERSGARPQALLGLLQHALADLFGEIVDIVLRHQHLDAVHEFFGGPGLPREGDAFLHQMDFGIQFVDRHPIAQVAIEAVSLLHENGLHGAVLAEETDHLAEIGAPAVLGGLDIHILGRNGESVGFGMITQQFELGGNGKALALLLA